VISLNSVVIIEDMNVESEVESSKVEMGLGQHCGHISMMFQFLSRKALRFIKRRLTAMQVATPDDQASDHSDEDDDFFVKTKHDNSTALMQLDEYLLSPSTEPMTATTWPLNKRLFFKTNTLPCQLALHARACSVQLGISLPQ